MKKIVLLLCSFVYMFAITQNFLEPEEAFKTSIVKENDKIIFTLKLGQDIYVYNDNFKVEITEPVKVDLTKEVKIPDPVEYDTFLVNFHELQIVVPIALIQKKVTANRFEITFHYQGCSKAGLCYAPTTAVKSFDLKLGDKTVEKPKVIAQSETDFITNSLEQDSLILILITFFGFGLLLSLTPCVFPMIPILSSIIVKAGNKGTMSAKKGFFLSLVYVLSMSIAYTMAGILAGLFGANLQVALQNPYVLIVFAGIFILLAFSMFGYFRLEPPKWLQTTVYKKTEHQQKEGIFGIAVMGFLSALIVGPCVAPPLAGALVYIGQTGDAVLGGIALFVLSLGMGVPLLVIGAGAGKAMPKPGGWMDTISKIFGLVMLGIAVWMLDRVIPNYVIYLWSVLLIGSGFYFQRYKHILLKTVMVLLLTYGVIGFIGAISGAKDILNPLEKLIMTQTNNGVKTNNTLQWQTIKNIEELNSAIKNSTQPVMLDFYAQWCVACKELEEITFKDELVIKKLQGFTLLKADVTQNSDEDKALQKKYGIFGPPGLIFWDEKNEEVKAAKVIGYKNPKDFLELLNQYF